MHRGSVSAHSRPASRLSACRSERLFSPLVACDCDGLVQPRRPGGNLPGHGRRWIRRVGLWLARSFLLAGLPGPDCRIAHDAYRARARARALRRASTMARQPASLRYSPTCGEIGRCSTLRGNDELQRHAGDHFDLDAQFSDPRSRAAVAQCRLRCGDCRGRLWCVGAAFGGALADRVGRRRMEEAARTRSGVRVSIVLGLAAFLMVEAATLAVIMVGSWLFLRNPSSASATAPSSLAPLGDAYSNRLDPAGQLQRGFLWTGHAGCRCCQRRDPCVRWIPLHRCRHGIRDVFSLIGMLNFWRAARLLRARG